MGKLLRTIATKMEILEPGQAWSERNRLVPVFMCPVNVGALNAVAEKHGARVDYEMSLSLPLSLVQFFNPNVPIPTDEHGRFMIAHHMFSVPPDNVEAFRRDI